MKKILLLIPFLLLAGCGSNTKEDICEDALQELFDDSLEISKITDNQYA